MRSALSKKRGFTLIELLVVVAIIGVLASVIIASLNGARSKSRDARRKVDLKQVQVALELYNNSNSSYPSTPALTWYGTCTGYGTKSTSGATGWVPNLAPTFISVLPIDPKPIEPNGCYLYRSDGIDYKLLAYTTVENTVSSSDSFSGRGITTYQLYTQGAVSW